MLVRLDQMELMSVCALLVTIVTHHCQSIHTVVGVEPRITNVQDDVVVFETNADGSNADLVLNCEVSGDPTPTVAWFRGGVTVPSEYILSNGSLLIENITEGEFTSQVGVVYYCTATNTLGNPAYNATVRSRDITVYYAFFGGFAPTSEDPVFLPTTSDPTVIAQQTQPPLAMECLVLESQPPPEIEWFLTENGMTTPVMDAGAGNTVRILEGGRFLYVRNVNMFPREYHCEVANARIHERETGGTRYMVNGSGLVDGEKFVYKNVGNRTAMLGEMGFGVSYVAANGLNILNCDFTIDINADIPTVRGLGSWPEVTLGSDGSNVRTVSCVPGGGTGILTIFDSVAIPSPPATNREAIVGGGALSFSCASTGLPTPTLEWFINSQPAMNTPGVTISGDTLSIAAPLVSHSGVYQCFASNTAPSGSEARASWALEVREPVSPSLLAFNPAEIGGVSDRQVGALVVKDPGSMVTVSVMVEADPCPSVQWRFGDTAISDGADYTISDPCPGTSSPFTYSLTVSSLTLSRSGEYSATFTNLAGSATLPRLYITVPVTSDTPVSSLTLTVQNEPSAQCLLNASTVFITCNTNGFPRPSVSFERDGSPVNLMNRFSQPFTDQLMITGVASTDAGTYTCSDGNTLKVLDLVFCTKPVIILSSFLSGEELTVMCEFSGIPQPVVVWMKDGSFLQAGGNIDISTPQDNPNLSRVTITSATAENNGLYTCTGSNAAGSVSSSISVTALASAAPVDSLSTESIIGLAISIPGLLLLFTLDLVVAVLLVRMVYYDKNQTKSGALKSINPAYGVVENPPPGNINPAYGVVENPPPANTNPAYGVVENPPPANINSDVVEGNSPTKTSEVPVESATEYDYINFTDIS